MHQLLHNGFFHTKYTIGGILKSQLMRFKGISSTKYDYDNTCKVLFGSLKNRGYTGTDFRKQQKDIWFENKRKNTTGEKEKIPSKTLPIVVNYDSVGMTV